MSLTLKDFLRICRKRIWLILVCVCLFAAGGVLYSVLPFEKTQTAALAFMASVDPLSDMGTTDGKTQPTPDVNNWIQVIGQALYYRQIAEIVKAQGFDARVNDLTDAIRFSSVSSTYAIYVRVTTENADYSLAVAHAIETSAEAYLRDFYPNVGLHLRVINPPIIVDEVAHPNLVKYTVLYAVIGLILSLIILYLIAYFDVRVRNEQDLIARYDLPVLGVLPSAERKRKSTVGCYPARDGGFALVEAYRTLMTSVSLAGGGDKCGALSVCVCSSSADEGKSAVAANLAGTFAEVGRRVLLLDGDMRQGCQRMLFDVSPAAGLSEYLREEAEIADLIAPTQWDGLDIVTAGAFVDNPISLLQNGRFAALLAELNRRYDYILIDTPPLAIVADALSVAAETDGMLFVAAENRTKHPDLLKNLQRLETSRCKMLGLVLNESATLAQTYGKLPLYGSCASCASDREIEP